MRSSFVRAAAMNLLFVVTLVLLVAVGYLARLSLEDGESRVSEESPARQHTAIDAAPITDQGARNVRSLASEDAAYIAGLIEEVLQILEEEYVEPDRLDRALLYGGALNGLTQAIEDPASVRAAPQPYPRYIVNRCWS